MDNKTATTAPYNFIPIENRVLKRAEKTTDASLKQNHFSKDLYTGTISYNLKTITPLHISDGNNGIFKNPEGIPVIPGNTIRGLTRFNASIFSYASVMNETIKKKDIEDRRFYYRSFTSTDRIEKDNYKQVTGLKTQKEGNYQFAVLENVQAGYIRKEGKNYVITPATKHSRGGLESKQYSYTPVHEHQLRQENIKGVHYMYQGHLTFQDYKDKHKLGRASNRQYTPYYIEANYQLREGRPAVKQEGSYKGMLANSNYMRGKVRHYLIHMEDENQEAIVISKEQAEIYKQDLEFTDKLTKNTMEIKSDFTYYSLPDGNTVKPVFYIQTEHEDFPIIFGFTPYLRLPAQNSIYDGLPEEQQDFKGVDWTDAIFGFMGYRTKVSFQDAILQGQNVPLTKSYQMVLADPKASWYKGYVEQKDGSETLSYNAKDFRIRGRKFYWTKETLDIEAIGNSTAKLKNADKIASSFQAIEADVSFEACIRFENLSKLELGLLLYALNQGESDGKCNLGKGKPYGFGHAQITINELLIEDISKKYKTFSASYSQAENPQDFMEAFKAYIIKETGVESVDELMAYQAYMTSKKTLNFIRTRYIHLSDFRKADVLPSPDGVIRGRVSPPTQTNSKNTQKPTSKNGTSSKNKNKHKQNKRSEPDFSNNPFAKFKDKF